MPSFKCFLKAAALASGLLLDGAHACACLAEVKDLCMYVDEADVVLRATVLTKTDGVGFNADATYAISPVTFYKAELNVSYSEVVNLVTGSSTAACGAELDIGEDYLLGLSRVDDPLDTEADGQLTVGYCGLVDEWDSVDQDELSFCDDPCDGACGEFQVCSYFAFSLTYYCEGSCDPSPCDEDEECVLHSNVCIPEVACPSSAVCIPAGVCDDTKRKNQECEYLVSTEECYCFDV